jgi:hypothetical protein
MCENLHHKGVVKEGVVKEGVAKANCDRDYVMGITRLRPNRFAS